jgi:hypothetical protein
MQTFLVLCSPISSRAHFGDVPTSSESTTPVATAIELNLLEHFQEHDRSTANFSLLFSQDTDVPICDMLLTCPKYVGYWLNRLCVVALICIDLLLNILSGIYLSSSCSLVLIFRETGPSLFKLKYVSKWSVVIAAPQRVIIKRCCVSWRKSLTALAISKQFRTGRYRHLFKAIDACEGHGKLL